MESDKNVKKKKKGKKVVGGFLAQPLSQRRANTALGQIYGGYLWSSRNEPMGLNYRTQRSVSYKSNSRGAMTQ